MMLCGINLPQVSQIPLDAHPLGEPDLRQSYGQRPWNLTTTDTQRPLKDTMMTGFPELFRCGCDAVTNCPILTNVTTLE